MHLILSTGTLPSEIASLSFSYIGIYNNFLSGNLPTEIWSMEKLKGISTSQNNFTGTLGSEIGLLPDDLNYLILYKNSFTGSFPTEIGRLSGLKWLWINDNSLTGIIPSEMGLLTSLSSLRVNGNYFTEGPIPVEICDLSPHWLWADCGKNDCSCCTQCCGNGDECAPP